MSTWSVSTAATSMIGIVTEQRDHDERDAFASLTDLGDGTATISISIHVPGAKARELADKLLADVARLALPSDARR